MVGDVTLADQNVLDTHLRGQGDVDVSDVSRPLPGESVLLSDRDPAIRRDLRQHGRPGKRVARIVVGRRLRGRTAGEEQRTVRGSPSVIDALFPLRVI